MRHIYTLLTIALLFVLITVQSPAQKSTKNSDGSVTTQGAIGHMDSPVRIIDFKSLPTVSQVRYSGPKKMADQEKGDEDEDADGEKIDAPNINDLKNVTIDKGALSSILSNAPVQVGAGINGISQGGFIPTEPSPAVGPYNIFAGGNSSVVVVNKDGSNRTEIDGLVFFGGPSSEGGISDLVCGYDNLHGRFVAVAFTVDAGYTYSHYYLAVSKTNDARGQWYTWQIDWRFEGATQTALWGDFEELGYSSDKFAISSQMFNSSGTYQHMKIRVWDINQLYSGTVTSFQDFSNFTGQVFVTKVSKNLSPGNPIYLLASTSGGASTIGNGSITGTVPSAVLTMNSTLSCQTYGRTAGSYHTGGQVMGGNTPLTVPTVTDNDCRMQNYVWRNGYMYSVFHTGVVIAPDTVDAIRFWKINTQTTPFTLVTDETFAAPATWYYYPSITVDSVGTVFIGMGRSTRTEVPSSYVTGKRRTDASIQPSVLAKAGLAQLGAGYSRWGDYTGSSMDESASGPGGSYAWYNGQATADANNAVNWMTQMYFPYSQVQGHVYLDVDALTGTSSDRRPLSGWTVTLTQGVNTLATLTTDANGYYNFGYLETGTYTVTCTQQVGNTVVLDAIPGSGGNSQTKVSSLAIQVSVTTGNTAQTSTGNDFLQRYQNGSISGYFFNDLNANGSWDSGEPALSNWTVGLSGTTSGSTTTDATGYYAFLNLAAGSYTVTQTTQSGYTQTFPVAGAYSLTLSTSTQQASTNNFGNYLSNVKVWTGGASTTNWEDANNWSPSGVPSASNDVNLTGANTININSAAVCNNLLLQNSSLALNIRSAGSGSLTVSGNLTMNSGTLLTERAFPSVTGTTTLSSGTVNYAASSGSQSVLALTYNNLVISGGGTKSFTGSTTINGSLSLTGGTLDLAGVTYTLAGALTVANGTTLKTGGSTISSLTNVSIGSTSTVEYSGGAENMLTATYGNLTVSGSGTKTMLGSFTVNGALTLNQVLATSTKTLTLGSSGSVSRTTGYVYGTFTKTVTTTGVSSWDIGTATDYLPISMNISSLSGTGPVTMALSSTNPASVYTGDATKAIGHYYTITVGSGINSITAIPSLAYTLTEFNALTGTGSDQTKLFLARWNGAAWVSQRTNSTLTTTAASGVNGVVSLTSGVSTFSPWAIFWGTDDSPLSAPAFNVKTWVGAGASGGNSSTDFNAAANWSPAGTPSNTDSCVMTLIANVAGWTIQTSADITVGALKITFAGGTTTEQDALFETAYNLVVQRTLVADVPGASTGAHTLQIFPGIVSGGPGTFTVNGRVILGRNTVSPYTVWIKGIAGSFSTWYFRGDSVICAAQARTSAANLAQRTVFDGTGTQVWQVDNTAGTFNIGNLQIGGGVNTPTVLLTGAGVSTINSAASLGADVTVMPGCTLDMGARTLNRSSAGGVFTVGAGATLRLSGIANGAGRSNFPLNYATYSIDSTSTVEYYGGAQTVFGTPIFGNLTFTNAGTKTDSLTTTIKGNLTINTGATYAASTFTNNLAGNFVNNGTFTQGTSTINMNGTTAQTISGTGTITFNNLTNSNTASTLSPMVNIGVGGTLSLGANTTFSPDAAAVINNGGAAGTISGTGTAKVTRIASTADFVNQYKFTTNTLTGLTVDYAGAGDQFINSTVGNYGALKTSGTGTKTLSGAVSVNNALTIGSSTILDASASAFGLNVAGAWNNNGSFTAQGNTVTLNGGAQQTIGGSSTTAFGALTLSNTGGVVLGTNAIVNGALSLGNVVVKTNANSLTLGSAATTSRGTGYVNGNLSRNIAPGSTTLGFDIGDVTNYTPVSLTFGTVSTGGTISAKSTGTEHPNIASSTLNSASGVNRYWTVTNSGVAFDTYDATLNWVPADVDAGANTATFGVGKYDVSSWTVPTYGSQTASSIQATGLTSFSDFAVANILGGGDNPAPLISGLVPDSVNAGSSTFTLTVNGTGFVASSTVNFRGVAMSTSYVSATQLTASIPASSVANGGVFGVTVTNPAPGGGTSASFSFSALHLVPTTTSISPVSGNVGGSLFTLTVNGTNFDSSSTVMFNGSSRTTTFASSTQLTATIPSTDLTTAGTFNITVNAPAPGGGTSNAQSFTVNNNLPTTTSLTTATKSAGSVAFTDTVNGTNFVSTSVVRWNGSNRTTTFISSTQLSFAVTATDVQLPAVDTVTVFNPIPGGGISNGQLLTVTTPTGVVKTWFSTTLGGDFNTASNWSPAGVPTVSDSCVFPMVSAATIPVVTLSGNITVGAIFATMNTATASRSFIIDPGRYTLDVKGTTTMYFVASVATTILQLGNRTTSDSGTVICEGPVNIGTAGVTTNGNIALVTNTNTRFIFKNNVTLAGRASTVNSNALGSYIFDGTGSQTFTYSNTQACNWGNVIIGSSNSPTVTLAGAGTTTAIAYNLTLNNNSILDYATGTRLNRASSGGSITLSSGSKLRIGGITAGQGTSNFPTGFTTFNFDANSTVEYYGGTQTVYGVPVYGHLAISTTGTKTAASGLSVVGNLTINNPATFAAGTSLKHTLYGNWVNNGTFSFTTADTMNFAGTSAQTISGSASTGFGTIIVNKGIDTTSTLEATGPMSMTGNLILTNGLFKVSNASASVQFSSSPTISATAGLWINGGSLSGGNFSSTNNGLLRLSSGTATFGTSSGNALTNGSTGLLDIQGGTFNVAGRLLNSGTLSLGSATLNICTVGLSNGSNASFEMQGASNLNASAGSIVFQNANAGAGGDFTITSGSGTKSISGGTVQFGNASTPVSQAFKIKSPVALNLLTVNTTNSPSLQLVTSSLTVNKDLTVGSGATLNANNLDLTVGGNWANSGTFTPGTGTVTLSGNGGQTITGSPFNNLTIIDGTGVTMLSNTTVNGTLALQTGTFTVGANTLSLNGPAISGTASNLSTSSSSSLSFGGSSSSITVPSQVTALTNLTVNNSNGVGLNSNLALSGTLTMTTGNLSTGSTTITLGTSGTLSEAAGSEVVGNITTTRDISATSGLQTFGGLGANINLNGTALGSTSMLRVTGSASTGNGKSSILRKFVITPTTNTGLNADVTFHYDDNDLNGKSEGTLEAYKSTDNGSSWTNRGGSVNSTANTISVTGLNDFSTWTASDTSNALGNTPAPTTTSLNVTSKVVGEAPFTLTVNGSEFMNGRSTVQFNGVNKVTTFVNNSQLTVPITSGDLASAGSYPVTVFTTGGGGTSNAQTFNVSKAGTTLDLTSSLNPSTFTDSVTFTATTHVTAPGSGTATGTVTFTIDGVAGTPVALSGGTASFGTRSLTASGSPHSVIATYNGDSNDSGSVSSTLSQTVNKSTPSISLGSSLNPSNYNQSVTFAATLGSSLATGTVEFFDGATSLGSSAVSGGVATKAISSLAVGTHSITAVYNGDGDFNTNTSSAVSQVVNLISHTITASAGTNGSIAPAGSVVVYDDSTKQFSFTPDAHYHVDSLIVDGVAQTISSSYTFSNVTADHTIHVAFAIDTYTITASSGSNGSITPSGSVVTSYGSTSSFAFTPSTGYHVDSVFVDGSSVDSLSGYTFAGISANHTIHVTFAINMYTITASAGSNGSISPTGVTSLSYGQSQSYTVTPETGYHVADVLVDGNSVGAVSSYSFDTVKANHTISASFAINTYSIEASAGNNGSITPSGSISANYGDSKTFTFAATAGHHVDSVIVDDVVVNFLSVGKPHLLPPTDSQTDTSYTFDSVKANHTIRVTFLTNEYVLTPSAGAGGSIDPSTPQTVFYGASQTFTVTPDTGYSIADVLVDGVSVGAVPSYSFTSVTANHTIEASFGVNLYPLTVSTTGNGSVTKNPDHASYTFGSSVELTAVPGTGYHFVNWTGDTTSTSNPITITISGARNLTAHFAINTYTITSSAGTNGTISPDGATSLNYGASQAYVISPATGYHVADVLVDGSSVGAVTNYSFDTVKTNHTISATFAINTYTITASAGANGTIAPNGVTTLNYNQSQAYTVTPATGYHIVDVLVDGNSVGTVGSYSFDTVKANHTISASFAINTYTITSSAGANGSISPNGSTIVNYNGSQAYTVTPGTGYHVVDVLVDGSSVGAVANYTFDTVKTNHTISASFAINTYTLTSSAGANGSISPNGVTTVNYGSTQAYSITPATGYHVSDVLVDGNSVGAVTSYSFNSVNANHTISASFAINAFTITSSAGAHGSISPNGSTPVNYNGSQSYTVTPGTGYHIADVLVDGNSVGAVASYTFDTVKTNHTISASFAINTYTITASAGANGSIAPNGVTTLNYSSSQAYTITPSTGYHVADVLVDGSSVGAVTNYAFDTVKTNHTISATFAINTFTITASAGANGSIAPNGVTNVNYGSNQALTITPATGYHVADVLVDGNSVGAVASYTFFTVTGNHTISASFAINTYTITASAGSNGGIAPGTTVLNYGSNQRFAFTPSVGYHVDSVLVDGVLNADSVAGYTFANVTNNHSISVKFKINSYSITVTQGTNGTITPGTTTLSYGGSQRFTYTANTGYHIDSVFVDGIYNADSLSGYTFANVSANHAFTVKYKINSYTITVTQGTHGTIAPGTSSVNYGGSLALTITPALGYQIDSVLVDGLSVGSSSSYSFTNVTANHTITASFSVDSYELVVNTVGNGSVSKNPDQVSYTHGTSVQLSATPASGWVFSAWSGDASGSTNPITVTMSANKSVTATFVEDPAYLVKYRSFNPDSIVLDKDTKGKYGKPVASKPVRAKFSLVLTTGLVSVDGLHVEFGSAIDTTFSFTTDPPSFATPIEKSGLKKWEFTFSPALTPGSTVTISGYNNRGAFEKVGIYWWLNGVERVGSNIKNPPFAQNTLCAPMPNRINVLQETFEQGGFTSSAGMVVGVAKAVKDSAKHYGWVVMKKYSDLVASLGKIGKTGVMLHTGSPNGFDVLTGGKQFLGKKTSLPPTVQNNKLFANLAALKISIKASSLLKTPVGFGELVFSDTVANPYNGLMLKQIAAKADTMVTGYPGRTFENAGTYATLSSTIERILNAFEGEMDTTSFIGKLTTTGTHPVLDYPFIRVNPSATPDVITPVVQEHSTPDRYTLEQNYPNPFNPMTTIEFNLPVASNVTLKIFNLLGQEVATVLNQQDLDEGTQSVQFDATNFASGVYMYRLTVESVDEDGIKNSFTSIKKMILVK